MAAVLNLDGIDRSYRLAPEEKVDDVAERLQEAFDRGTGAIVSVFQSDTDDVTGHIVVNGAQARWASVLHLPAA